MIRCYTPCEKSSDRLILAAENRNPVTLTEELYWGADPNATDSNGTTASIVATENSAEEHACIHLLDVLRHYGADITKEIKPKNHTPAKTVLNIAGIKNYAKVIAHLLPQFSLQAKNNALILCT